MASIIQLTRGTKVAWGAANPVLAEGQFGWETDTNKLKLGDGSTAWNGLLYGILNGKAVGTRYSFDNAVTDALPSDGFVRLNNVDPSLVTYIYVNEKDYTGADVAAWVDRFDSSTTTSDKGTLRIEQNEGDAFVEYVVSGNLIDGAGYQKIPVTYLSNGGSLNNNDICVMSFLKSGNSGSGDLSSSQIGTDIQAYSVILQGTTASFKVSQENKLGLISITQSVDLDQMKTDVAELGNAVIYKDNWDASGGVFPAGGVAQTGWMYNVSVSGTVDGVDFNAGDSLIAKTDNASANTYTDNWVKKDQTDAVASVAGQTGVVVLSAGDINSGVFSIARLPEAPATEFLNNTADKLLSTDQVWTAAAPVALTDGAIIAVDLDTMINASVTLAGNRTLSNPANIKVGQTGWISVKQDATGTRTLVFGSNYVFTGGNAPVLSTAANVEDVLFYACLESGKVLITIASGIAGAT